MNASANRTAALAILVLWIGCAHGPKPIETGTLAGKVVDTRGSAVGGARVSLMGPPRDGYDANGSAESIITRTDGTFQFRELFPGIYTVDVSTDSYGTRLKKDAQIDPGRVTEVELIVPAPAPPIPTETRMGTIRGTVVGEDGRGIRGASVIVRGAQRGGLSDSQGRFLIPVPIGTYAVRVLYVGHERVDRSGVHVSEDDTTTVDFQLVPAPVRFSD